MMLVPASDRPYVGDSTDNSWFQLIFEGDGIQRVAGHAGAFASHFEGNILYLLDSHVAGQIAWLLPLAIVGLVLGLRGHVALTARRPGLRRLSDVGHLDDRLRCRVELLRGRASRLLHLDPRTGCSDAGCSGGRDAVASLARSRLTAAGLASSCSAPPCSASLCSHTRATSCRGCDGSCSPAGCSPPWRSLRHRRTHAS